MSGGEMKKKAFTLDEDGGEGMGGGAEAQEVEVKEAEPEELHQDGDDDGRKKEPSDVLDDLNFFNLKKKKKSKKVFDYDVEEALKELKIEGEQPEALEEDGLDLMLPPKKKSKKEHFGEGEPLKEEKEEEQGEINDGISLASSTGPPWAGSERDYTYDELLSRAFAIMREKNPDSVAGERKKLVVRPPQVIRAGTKKTSFVNLGDICNLLHRQPEHLFTFLLAELGTSGSIDGNDQLVIKGTFQQKQIGNVVRRYIKEYVTCHTCRSPETSLQRGGRLRLLQCETCRSRRSVASITAGFQAVTAKRAK